MSWCGCSTSLSSQDLIKFLNRCGANLTHLKLNSVSFLNGPCVDTIGRVCQNLNGKCGLRSCSHSPTIPFSFPPKFIQSSRLGLIDRGIVQLMNEHLELT